MRITRTAAVLLGALAVLALAVPATAAGLPGTGKATVSISARSCNEQDTYSYFEFAPASVTEKWTANSCGWLESPELLDNAGQTHYGDYWRSALNTNSVASSPNSMTNGKAWIRYKKCGSCQHYCLRVYPTKGTSWFACT